MIPTTGTPFTNLSLPTLATPTPEDSRNVQRISSATATDSRTIGKFLTPTDLFSATVSGPDDHFCPPPWLYDAILAVFHSPVPTPRAPSVKFDLSDESLAWNSQVIRECGYDLENLFAANVGTTLSPGSEFRPPDQLSRLFSRHPNFNFFMSTIRDGMGYEFETTLSEDERQTELAAMIQRGNHQSAVKHSTHVAALLAKDVRHGFSLPCSPDLVTSIKQAMVQPCGVVEQFALTETGDRKLKRRLTQDLSFSLVVPRAAVNQRIDMTKYPPMFYGHCFSRILHFVSALRERYPTTPIFIAKYDYSDAYRRMAHSPSAAAQSIIIFQSIAYIALRLTFGGSANPPGFCAFSEMVADLANEIRLCNEWDGQLRSPAQPQTPTALRQPKSIPFQRARPCAVKIPTTVTGRTECFIDDLINVFLGSASNILTEPHVVPLAIHLSSRPHADQQEPVPRRQVIQPDKLVAEGTPAEIQIVLGWSIDTRSLRVSLPFDKFKAWSTEVSDIVSAGKCSSKHLESTIGKLNHASHVIPLARHFLNRIRIRVDRANSPKHVLQLSNEELADLVLWQTFLAQAHRGISINNLTIRTPTKVGWSDSCPLGLGGFTCTGRAWRLLIPTDSILRVAPGVNNVLEFLALAVNTMAILHDLPADSRHECIMALGDNTSALGWLYRQRFEPSSNPLRPAKLHIARSLAQSISESHHCLLSQHIKGEANVVADFLSFAGDDRSVKPHPLAADNPSDTELTRRFHLIFPQLIPQSFDICPLPPELLSFACRTLQMCESSLIRAHPDLTPTTNESGHAGNSSAPVFTSTITSTSIVYPRKTKSSSSAPSWNYTGPPPGDLTAAFQANVQDRWLQQLSALPQGTWLRRFGQISNQVPCTQPAKPASSPPSSLSSPPTNVETPQPNATAP